LVATPPDGQFIERYVRGSSGWAFLDFIPRGQIPLEVQAASIQTTSGLQSIIALLDLSGTLHITGSRNRSPLNPVVVDSYVEPGVDVEPWGENALIAYATNGKIFVGVFWVAQNAFIKISAEQPDDSWNGGSSGETQLQQCLASIPN
jgi:hypothetical protein